MMGEEQQRLMREGLRRKMKRLAVARQCPECRRKMAITRRSDGDYVEWSCRWCGWCKGRYLSLPEAPR
jgi:ribosomal protein L37AE/L43A